MRDRSDERRFEGFYEAHHDRVAAYLLSRTDRDSAQDALARTFEIAWRRFDDVPAQQLPWLLGVARRTLAAQRRAQGRRDALFERIATGQGPVAHDNGELLIRREQLLHALSRLTEREQETVLLVAWDGLSHQEAASALGCSRVAVAVRVHRARRRLAQALTEDGESPSRLQESSPRTSTAECCASPIEEVR